MCLERKIIRNCLKTCCMQALQLKFQHCMLLETRTGLYETKQFILTQCLDRVIEREMSDELLKYFQTPDIIRHPGGHFVPTTGDQKKSFITFFEKMQTSFA